MKNTDLIPCLWFDHQSEEAVNFYLSVFKNGKTGTVARYPEGGMMPEGSVMTIKFRLAGQDFIALNGGPEFSFTPATSFFVGCESLSEFDHLWTALSQGGIILMDAGPMPSFFEKFGWLQDRYGLSWQLGICGIPQYITPYLLFAGKQHGQAEEAITFYRSVFKSSDLLSIIRYGNAPDGMEGTVQHASFSLMGQEFMAADGGPDHSFTFTEAVSFYVYCQSQSEIDTYWENLSEGGEKGPCGWLKDKFGISWQIVPAVLEKMMDDENPQRIRKVMEALMKMTKLDMKTLVDAYESV